MFEKVLKFLGRLFKLHTTIDEDDLYAWEESFGVDNPDYLPYWIEYMPVKQRLRYLNECGRQFSDFRTEMLSPDFDWKNDWEVTH